MTASSSPTFKISSQSNTITSNSEVWHLKTQQLQLSHSQPIMKAYLVDCQEAVQCKIPEGIALSPVEETFRSYEDVLSLFSAEIDSPTPLQSPSAMFSAGKSNASCMATISLPRTLQ